MTHLALTRLCVLSRGVPRSFVLQVLVMQFDISSPTWQRKYHFLNLQICTVSQVNRVVLSSLLTRHAVLEDRHVDPDTGPESGSLAAVRLDMYLGTLTSAHLGNQQLCPKNLCVTNVAFVGLPLFALCFLEHSIAKSLWMSCWQWLHRLPKSAKELC